MSKKLAGRAVTITSGRDAGRTGTIIRAIGASGMMIVRFDDGREASILKTQAKVI